ncbi:uncharacterized protein METZ01_LOCUS210520 [marine metagenome]|jgi:uncharacterized protein (DUF2164 family)|uniref:DUF2164 domain-containing protein n=1 Tax=marine metagenome TaxID=408172 RepID=A0A382F3R8_9ZZZZ
MAIVLDEQRREGLINGLEEFFTQEFDEELSSFRSEHLLDFFLGALGPQVYNQGVQDARRFVLDKLEDIDGEVYEHESF